MKPLPRLSFHRQLAALLLGVLAAATRLGAEPTISFGPVCGAVGSNTASFTLGVSDPSARVQLLLSTNQNWDAPVARAWPSLARSLALGSTELSLTDPLRPMTDTRGTDATLHFTVQGLQPATRYHYAISIDNRLLKESTGQFRTFPAGAASFQFGFGNSLRTHRPEISGLTAATKHDILFFLNTGDLFYEDIEINSPALFRQAYRAAFNRPADRQLLRHTPLVFIWDDHDFGPNNADSTAPGKAASRHVYREMVPHYSLPAGPGNEPIYQAFTVGRVRFILTDLRSERSPTSIADGPEKSMMGRAQLAWFEQELAAAASQQALVIWVSSVPWTAPERAGADHWGGYAHERRRIANWIKQNKIRNLLIIAGDAHSTAADDGRHGDYATGGGAPIPTVIAAPLDNTRTSLKGGRYSQGQYAPTGEENMFGLVSIRDDGQQISFQFSGRNNRQEEKIRLEFKPPAR